MVVVRHAMGLLTSTRPTTAHFITTVIITLFAIDAAVVEPGAVRLGVSRNTNLSSLSHAEFLNPDGTYITLLCNARDTDIKVTLSDGNKYFLATVPAYGIVSLKWQK